MAALHSLWTALVLLGALGGLQTRAEAQVSVQPHFQQDKVRCSPAQCPGWEGGTLWGGAVSLGTGELSKAASCLLRPRVGQRPLANWEQRPASATARKHLCLQGGTCRHAGHLPAPAIQSHTPELMTPAGNAHGLYLGPGTRLRARARRREDARGWRTGWAQKPECAWVRALRTLRRLRAHARGLRWDTAPLSPQRHRRAAANQGPWSPPQAPKAEIGRPLPSVPPAGRPAQGGGGGAGAPRGGAGWCGGAGL